MLGHLTLRHVEQMLAIAIINGVHPTDEVGPLRTAGRHLNVEKMVPHRHQRWALKSLGNVGGFASVVRWKLRSLRAAS
jgi:hypothetical protein